MNASFQFDSFLNDPDQLENILSRSAASVDDEIGVHVGDAGSADFVAFESTLVDEGAG